MRGGGGAATAHALVRRLEVHLLQVPADRRDHVPPHHAARLRGGEVPDEVGRPAPPRQGAGATGGQRIHDAAGDAVLLRHMQEDAGDGHGGPNPPALRRASQSAARAITSPWQRTRPQIHGQITRTVWTPLMKRNLIIRGHCREISDLVPDSRNGAGRHVAAACDQCRLVSSTKTAEPSITARLRAALRFACGLRAWPVVPITRDALRPSVRALAPCSGFARGCPATPSLASVLTPRALCQGGGACCGRARRVVAASQAVNDRDLAPTGPCGVAALPLAAGLHRHDRGRGRQARGGSASSGALGGLGLCGGGGRRTAAARLLSRRYQLQLPAGLHLRVHRQQPAGRCAADADQRHGGVQRQRNGGGRRAAQFPRPGERLVPVQRARRRPPAPGGHRHALQRQRPAAGERPAAGRHLLIHRPVPHAHQRQVSARGGRGSERARAGRTRVASDKLVVALCAPCDRACAAPGIPRAPAASPTPSPCG
jgi:hypothetical protein